MNPILSLDSSSTESDDFYVQRSSTEGSPARNNTPAVLNSTHLSGAMAKWKISISSVASPEPHIVTIDSDSNEPTIPYGFGNQHPIVQPSLDDLNLPPNPVNVLATMAIIQPDEEHKPQSSEPPDPSPISTPPMNLSTIECWKTPQATTDDATFYFEVEPRRVYWHTSPNETFDSNEPIQILFISSPSSTPPPPLRQKSKLRLGTCFLEKKGEFCSTPLRHVASPYQQERHPDAQEKLKHQQ